MDMFCCNCKFWVIRNSPFGNDGYCTNHTIINEGGNKIMLGTNQLYSCQDFSPKTFTCITCKKNLHIELNINGGGVNTCRHCEAKERTKRVDRLSNVTWFINTGNKVAVCYFCENEITDIHAYKVHRIMAMPTVPSCDNKYSVRRFCCNKCLPPLLEDYPEWFS